MVGAGAMATETTLLEKILDLVRRIEQKITEFYNMVSSKLQSLQGYLLEKARAGLAKLGEVLREFWAQLRRILGMMGSPSTLQAAAQMWTENVGGPVSGKIQVAEAGALDVDDFWAGRAAEQYGQALPLQKTALEQMKAHADAISTALSNVATGIYVFWAGLAAALLAVIAGIVGGVTLTGTVVGIPLGVLAVVAACAGGVAAIAGTTAALHVICTSSASSMDQKFNDNSGYLNGHWPVAALV
jgi:hypothetical protein